MSDLTCPKCGKSNRATARFCIACGGSLAGAMPVQPGIAQQVHGMAGRVAQAAAPAAQRAVQAAVPVAQQAAQQSWQASKHGMNWFTRLITGGGRSAYTEIINPQPVIAGQVVAPPQEDWVGTPLEVSALVFYLSLLLGWLVFLLPEWWQQLLVILGSVLVLLILNFIGLRRPAFSRLFWTKILGRAKQVPRLTCQVQDQRTGRPVRLTIIGPHTPGVLYQGANLLAYGLRDAGQNEIRAWKIDLDNGQSVIAPRLMPLAAIMLLTPLLLVLGWLLRWGIPAIQFILAQLGWV